jgi:hypothetical protein
VDVVRTCNDLPSWLVTDPRTEVRTEIADVRVKIAEAKSELIRWSVGSTFASVGMFAAITRLLAH